MEKNRTISLRLNVGKYEAFSSIFRRVPIDFSSAVRIFVSRFIKDGGFPFAVRLPQGYKFGKVDYGDEMKTYSVRVNADEWNIFSQIAEELNITSSHAISIFISLTIINGNFPFKLN